MSGEPSLIASRDSARRSIRSSSWNVEGNPFSAAPTPRRFEYGTSRWAGREELARTLFCPGSPSRDVAAPLQVKPEGAVRRLRDPDPGRLHDLSRPALRPPAGEALRRPDLEGTVAEGDPVQVHRDAERLRQFPRAACKRERVVRPPSLPHQVNPDRRLERPDEDRTPCALWSRHDVDAGIQAVDPVDIRTARRSEQNAVPLCLSPERVGRRVPPEVRLVLDDPPGRHPCLLLVHEQAPQQVLCDGHGVVRIEFRRENHGFPGPLPPAIKVSGSEPARPGIPMPPYPYHGAGQGAYTITETS